MRPRIERYDSPLATRLDSLLTSILEARVGSGQIVARTYVQTIGPVLALVQMRLFECTGLRVTLTTFFRLLLAAS